MIIGQRVTGITYVGIASARDTRITGINNLMLSIYIEMRKAGLRAKAESSLLP